jgi:hypothetical protein
MELGDLSVGSIVRIPQNETATGFGCYMILLDQLTDQTRDEMMELGIIDSTSREISSHALRSFTMETIEDEWIGHQSESTILAMTTDDWNKVRMMMFDLYSDMHRRYQVVMKGQWTKKVNQLPTYMSRYRKSPTDESAAQLTKLWCELTQMAAVTSHRIGDQEYKHVKDLHVFCGLKIKFATEGEVVRSSVIELMDIIKESSDSIIELEPIIKILAVPVVDAPQMSFDEAMRLLHQMSDRKQSDGSKSITMTRHLSHVIRDAIISGTGGYLWAQSDKLAYNDFLDSARAGAVRYQKAMREAKSPADEEKASIDMEINYQRAESKIPYRQLKIVSGDEYSQVMHDLGTFISDFQEDYSSTDAFDMIGTYDNVASSRYSSIDDLIKQALSICSLEISCELPIKIRCCKGIITSSIDEISEIGIRGEADLRGLTMFQIQDLEIDANFIISTLPPTAHVPLGIDVPIDPQEMEVDHAISWGPPPVGPYLPAVIPCSL